MEIDVIVPTFNRSASLSRTLRSLSDAPTPPGLTVSITVVDNNSSDDTRAIVEAAVAQFRYPLRYLLEQRQGPSYARNAGIAHTSGDVIGFVDDDEEIGVGWYQEVFLAFSNQAVDFIGGPYVPQWAIAPPSWLTPRLAALLGAFNPGDRTFEWRHDSSGASGALPGGNAVIRRSAIDKVGSFCPSLAANEDTELFMRLLDSGAKGLYVPNLVVYHHIPANRLTKGYARKLKFRGAVTSAKIDLIRQPAGPRIMGVPRYIYGATLREFGHLLKAIVENRMDELFERELAIVYFVGFLYGRYKR
jgi:glycosyltransferase involved in cell wall biosynthesis